MQRPHRAQRRCSPPGGRRQPEQQTFSRSQQPRSNRGERLDKSIVWIHGETTRHTSASGMTARHSPLFTLESGQSGLRIYTSQRDAAPGQRIRQIRRVPPAGKSQLELANQDSTELGVAWPCWALRASRVLPAMFIDLYRLYRFLSSCGVEARGQLIRSASWSEVAQFSMSLDIRLLELRPKAALL